MRKSSEANYRDALFPGFAFRPKTGEQSFELFIWSNILFIVCCCSEEYFVIPDFWQRKSFQNGARYSCPDSSWFPLHPEVMQWIGWDSAKECLRGSACILSSSPLTFWSWHGACGSFCPSAVFPVTMPKTFYFPSSDPCTWCINAVFDVALLPGSRKWCYSRTFISAALQAGDFHLRMLFSTCLLPKTNSTCSLYLRSSSQFRIQASVTLVEAKQWAAPKMLLEPSATDIFVFPNHSNSNGATCTFRHKFSEISFPVLLTFKRKLERSGVKRKHMYGLGICRGGWREHCKEKYGEVALWWWCCSAKWQKFSPVFFSFFANSILKLFCFSFK